MEIRITVATKAKLMRQMLIQKERDVIQVLCDLGEWQTPISKPISFCHGKSPTLLSKTKTKASVHSPALF